MKRVVAMIVLGIGGLAAAIALTVGALALAGDVGSLVQPNLSGSASGSRSPSASEDDDPLSETPSPSVDDHGGGSDDSSGSDDSGGNSGSGSDNSGSGSDNSGSGSGDSGSHDDD
jgi:hypothetical protein